MLEAALLVPFLLFTCLACWDAGKLISVHSTMSSNADAVAEWASSDPELENGQYRMRFTGALPAPTPTPTTPPVIPPPPDPDLCLSALGYECEACSGSSCGGTCGGAVSAIAILCDAITRMESTGLIEIREGSSAARINFITPSVAPDRVEVIISARFNGLFLFNNEKVEVRKLLPYLGPR